MFLSMLISMSVLQQFIYIFLPVGLKLRMNLIDRLRRNAEITVSCATRLLIVLVLFELLFRATAPSSGGAVDLGYFPIR